MSLTTPIIDHPKAVELETINYILEQNPTILDFILKDLNKGRIRSRTGAYGMTAEQVLRAANEGNPADTDLTATMLERQKEIYGRYPLKAAMDGGFASKPNLPAAKGKGIKDVCFAKKKGLDELDMCRSRWVYKRLRNFRAGVEAVISWIKRSLGFNRCNWKGPRSFGSYVWLSVVSANLRTLAAGHTA